MSSLLFLPILIPIAGALIVLFVKRAAWSISFTVALSTLVMAALIFLKGPAENIFKLKELGVEMIFRADPLSNFALLAISFFVLLVVIYSLRRDAREEGAGEYFGNILLALGASSGVVLSSNIVLLIVFWGMSGLALYNLLTLGGAGADDAAKKTFVIVGGSDALMILGAAIIWTISGTLQISLIRINVEGLLPAIAYLCFLIPAFAKAGAMPLHSWIPDSSRSAKASVMALLPASLDKILGIYLLARMSLSLFDVKLYSFCSLTLLIVGSCTIVFAVFAALLQHDLKKLLSFHAVSQVGYMILGFGTGTTLGIAGGLFHMLNHAVYKSCLFLGAGAIEKEAGTTELDNLGGLAKTMPATFISMLIASFAISGIPPLNGFTSKWMIYQSITSLGTRDGGLLWILCLLAAMFGSALTLASFMKALGAIFFGFERQATRAKGDAPISMLAPMVILAFLCVAFGVLAFPVPLKIFILPIVGAMDFSGMWSPGIATVMLLTGILGGFAIFLFGLMRPIRTSPAFIGGELLSKEKLSQSGTNFYNSIKEMAIVRTLLSSSEKRRFDIYEQGKRSVLAASELLRGLQSGLLHTYIGWMLLGLVVLLFAVFRGI